MISTESNHNAYFIMFTMKTVTPHHTMQLRKPQNKSREYFIFTLAESVPHSAARDMLKVNCQTTPVIGVLTEWHKNHWNHKLLWYPVFSLSQRTWENQNKFTKNKRGATDGLCSRSDPPQNTVSTKVSVNFNKQGFTTYWNLNKKRR